MGKIKNMWISQQEEEEMLLEEEREKRWEYLSEVEKDDEYMRYKSTEEEFESECGARP